jgi:hypothetical protein
MAKKLNKLGVENSLWNNIRANKGSGKEPTKEMLKQERKINAKYANGGKVPIVVNNPNDPRLRAYNDSNTLYNQGVNLKNLIENSNLYNKTPEHEKLIMKNNNSFSTQPFGKITGNGIGKFIDNSGKKITLKSNKKIQPIDNLIYTRNESDYKTRKEARESFDNGKFIDKNISWIGHGVQLYKKPVQPYIYEKSKPVIEQNKQQPIVQEQQFQPDIVSTVTPQAKTKFYQGYDFMQETGLRPGDYTESQIQDAMKTKGTKKLTNKYAKGGRVLPRFGEAGTVNTGAGISDYLGYAQMAMPIAGMLLPDQQVKDTRGNVVGNKVDSTYAAGSKGLDWASKAAVAGPVASIAAGVLGAGVGYLENDENNKKIDAELRAANNSIYNTDKSNAFSTNKGNFTARQSNNTNMVFARGGEVVDQDMGNPNAELELNETFRDPMTGKTGMVDGPSHDEGGIEMSLAEGTQIWSDRLKHNGKTFANLTKPIINKISNLQKGLDNNPNSRFKENSIKLLNAQLDFFFNVQESNKQQDEMKRTLKKQEGGVVDDMGNYHYANGGIYIKPENRGKFTAYKERTGKTTEEALHSPNAHVRQMANFAKNAAGWKHADGGMVKYDDGGPVIGSINPATQKPFTQQEIDLYYSMPQTNKFGTEYVGAGNLANGIQERLYRNIPEATLGVSPVYENKNDYIDQYDDSSETLNNFYKKDLPKDDMNPAWDEIWNDTFMSKIPVMSKNQSLKPLNVNLPQPKLPNINSEFSIPKRNSQSTSPGLTQTPQNDFYMNNNVPSGNATGYGNEYEKQRSLDAQDQESTPEENSNALRERIEAYRRRGKIGQAATSVLSNVIQGNRLRNLAAPDKIDRVNYLDSMTTPEYVNYGVQRNAIEQGANAVSDKAKRYLGNSGSIMATVNAANLAKQQQLAESYQGQENTNAGISNAALAQRNQAAIAQGERNSAIDQENKANKYGYKAMIASGLNTNDAISASQMGQMFGNDVTFGNDLEKSRILGNRYEKKVWDSTDDNTIAANNSQVGNKQNTTTAQTVTQPATQPVAPVIENTAKAVTATKPVVTSKPKPKPTVKPFVKKQAPMPEIDFSNAFGGKRSLNSKSKFVRKSV